MAAIGALTAFLGSVQPCRSDTIGNLGYWDAHTEITGFSMDNGGSMTVGQTFRATGQNAAVNSITIPIEGKMGQQCQFQVGVAAWNGSRPSGPVLYLSEAQLTPYYNNWQLFTFNPNNLSLASGQEYILFVTPNNFVVPGISAGVSMGAVDGSLYTEGQFYDVVGSGLGIDGLFTQDWSGIPYDFAFSVTTVPEPTSWALLGLGSLFLLWRPRRA